MAKTFEIEVTVPEGYIAGDTFTVEVEVPKKSSGPRGQLSGLTLEDMTLEQLKRERINAKSVLYKAIKRGAAQETLDAAQARVDAVVEKIETLKAEAAAANTVLEEELEEAPAQD